MIDLGSEKPIPIQEAAELLGVCFTSAWRWLTSGVKSKDGIVVKLRAGRIGGKWYTSTQALQEFQLALTPQSDIPPPPVHRPASKRQRESEKAARELEKLGI
jgi:hypothetical protein